MPEVRKYYVAGKVIARTFLALCAGAGHSVHADDRTAYPPVTPGYRIEFPRDHGSHSAFRTEWWYVTGQVADARGRVRGFQVTFFRNRTGIGETGSSRFAPSQIIVAHAALADPVHGRLRHDQRAARAGFDLVYAREGRGDLRLDDWSMQQVDSIFSVHVAARDFSLDLKLAPTLAPLLHGDGGFSRKGPAPRNSSYYYSLPQIDVTGTISTDSRALEVSGKAWMDHEWSSEVMAPGAQGWDWVGVNLGDGGALMAFRMRGKDGRAIWAGGTRLFPGGRIVRYTPEEIVFTALSQWRSPRTSITYPGTMRLSAGSDEFEIRPNLDDQELDARATTGMVYWEGAVNLLRNGNAIGRGYLELTGYGGAVRF